MPEKSVSTAYIGTGCNKSAQIMDWGANDLICFGTCNSVAIYDPKLGKIISTLEHHNESVTALKWIQGAKNELISGSSDSNVIVWSLEEDGVMSDTSFMVLSGHQSSILAVDGRKDNDLGTIVTSSASDNSVRVWRKLEGTTDFVCEKVIDTGTSFALCLNSIPLPNSHRILLAYGTDSPEIMLYGIGGGESELSHLGKFTGHEDWIRCIDMTILNCGDILIASCSQDMMIRISRMSCGNSDLSDESFNIKKHEIIVDGVVYYLCLESVLYGHEGWVYSVQWSPCEENSSPLLLSSSFDRTLLIWRACTETGLWLEDSRMGELGGDNSLGYYGARFNPDGSSVLAYSYQGSFHLWRKSDSKWVPDYFIGGHVDSVTDICWERNGRYLVSVSSDKTTRLHAPCLRGLSFPDGPWCELSRPQIHGHALHSLTTLPNLIFASCSEEKVVRVFSPSQQVFKLLNHFLDSILDEDLNQELSLPSSASITALGLSNRANFDNDKKEDIFIKDINTDSVITPNEDYLVQNTLWPEVMKLYGHGNDVFTITASHSGSILATASKATSADQAKIILWDTNTWNIITKLEGHQLTITQMAFSPDDSFLLSVSRDRKWCLYKKSKNNTYKLDSVSPKDKIMHTRIIWTCAWTHDGLYFATGSRDSKVIVWNTERSVSSMTSKFGPVTALDFGPVFIGNGKYAIALGHESGEIQVFSCLQEWTALYTIGRNIGHLLTVRRLRFRPVAGDLTGASSPRVLQLASCSDDHSVRVFNVTATD